MSSLPPIESGRKAPVIRRAMRLANANAGLWAVGNGLVSTQLVIYLANDLGAQGMAVGLILAAPRFAGLLRLAVPALIAKSRRRKAVCILAYSASAIVLCGVPLVAPAHEYLTPAVGLAVLVGTWCVYHLMEYMGTVALWSWLGDLTPRRIRGRLLGQRERWLLVGRIGGIAASVGLALAWSHWLPNSPRWQPLRLSAILGAAMLLAAALPLAWMPAVNQASSAVPRAPWRSLLAALVDPRYRRLLTFNCWLAFVQGLTGAAQALYPPRVLGLPYFTTQGWYGLMYAGQSALAPSVGRLVDRFGNRPVMIVSGLLAATGPLFFLSATPERSWVIGGAFVVWIAYVGLNVGLDNIKLKLAPADNNAPYLAVYHATGELANGIAAVCGGLLFDVLNRGGDDAIWLYAYLFYGAWVGRTLAVALVARLIEPDARPLRAIADAAG